MAFSQMSQCYIAVLSCLLVILLQPAVYAFSVFLSMWTQGQVHVLNAGQNVELDCEFYAEEFNMFNNPVIWKKFQRQEQAEVNIMGNILPPFFSTGRFQVTLTSNPPRYRLRLRITELALEDSGNYTCEVRGPKSSIMAAVTHYIFIRAAVENVYFVADNTTSTSDGHITHAKGPPTQVTFIENTPGRLRCSSVGGYPPPELSIYLGDRDVTSMFATSTAATLHGNRGLRLMVHQTDRWTDRLTLTAADDGQTLQCVATVSGLGANTTSVQVLVNYAPIIRCPPVSAFLGDKNVRLLCEVRARPGPTALFWLIDINGTTVTEGVVIDEYWTLNMDRNDGLMESQLFMRKTSQHSFRTYTLYAENNIAVATADVQLVQKHRPVTSTVAPPGERHVVKTQRERTAVVNPRYTHLAARASSSSSNAIFSSSSTAPWLFAFVAMATTTTTAAFGAVFTRSSPCGGVST